VNTDQPVSNGNTPQTAAPRNTTIKTTIERGDAYLSPQLFNVEVTLLEVLRGQEAEERVRSQHITDKPPQNGYDYILARIQIGYFRRARGLEDEPYTLTEGQLAAFSDDGKIEYKIPPAQNQSQPSLVGLNFSPGDVKEGWILLQAPREVERPLLIYKRKHEEGAYGIWQGVWFQLF
jgi:hypothetical protein